MNLKDLREIAEHIAPTGNIQLNSNLMLKILDVVDNLKLEQAGAVDCYCDIDDICRPCAKLASNTTSAMEALTRELEKK